MKKIWISTLLALSIGMTPIVQAATPKIQVYYNTTQIPLSQEAVIRHDQIWIPVINTFDSYVNATLSYDKKANMLCISSETGETSMHVVKANSKEDDGYTPIFLNNTVYLSSTNIKNLLNRDVKWDKATKKLTISSLIDVYPDSPDTPTGQLKYDVDTHDFYNGKIKVANLDFDYPLDDMIGDKFKTQNNHVLYTLSNIYGEPHINSEFYSIYFINGGNHIAKGYCHGMGIKGVNAMVHDNTVTMINKNEIKVYDDTTGKVLKSHTISTQPLKDHLNVPAEVQVTDQVYQEALSGYILEGVGDHFVLYRNYELNTLTYVDLDTDAEIELYKEVFSPEELAKIEESIHIEGDGLKFEKEENGILYLTQTNTPEGKSFQYKPSH